MHTFTAGPWLLPATCSRLPCVTHGLPTLQGQSHHSPPSRPTVSSACSLGTPSRILVHISTCLPVATKWGPPHCFSSKYLPSFIPWGTTPLLTGPPGPDHHSLPCHHPLPAVCLWSPATWPSEDSLAGSFPRRPPYALHSPGLESRPPACRALPPLLSSNSPLVPVTHLPSWGGQTLCGLQPLPYFLSGIHPPSPFLLPAFTWRITAPPLSPPLLLHGTCSGSDTLHSADCLGILSAPFSLWSPCPASVSCPHPQLHTTKSRTLIHPHEPSLWVSLSHPPGCPRSLATMERSTHIC